MKLSIAPRGARQSVLVFGPPKTGKTELVGSLANDGFSLIWIDLENGHATLFKLPEEAQSRIELISLPDTRSYPIAIETCLKLIKGGPVSICEEHGKVDCALCKKSNAPVTRIELNKVDANTIVVFDSLTQLTNSAISSITKNQPDDYKLNYEDWGNLGKLMDIFLSHVQQAKFNVVCISHETEVEMEDGKMKIVPTAGTKNFSRNTAKYFGHVVYAEVKGMKHRFTSGTTSTVNIVVGSRTDVTLEKMNEPSLRDIFARSNDTERSRSNPVQTDGDRIQAESTGETLSRPAKDDSGAAETNGQIAASKLSGLAATLAAKRLANG